MKTALVILALLLLAVFSVAQGKGDPRIIPDPGAGFVIPISASSWWMQVQHPVGMRGLNLRIGRSFEGSDVADISFPIDHPTHLFDAVSIMPTGRLYATLTTITSDWRVIKRHYIWDSR